MSIPEEHFTRSSYRERLLEHVFIGDLLRRLWMLGYRDDEVLKPEVDQRGDDIVLECGRISRHVQFKKGPTAPPPPPACLST